MLRPARRSGLTSPDTVRTHTPKRHTGPDPDPEATDKPHKG